MSRKVEELVKQCLDCKTVAPIGRKVPLTRTMLPNKAWQFVAADLLGPLPDGRHVLLMTDYYSRFPEAKVRRSIEAKDVVNAFRETFARYGNPLKLRMDNGPHFNCALVKDYLEEECIQPDFSIPYWPMMNGQVENQNKTLKKVIQISYNNRSDVDVAIQEGLKVYRASPQVTTGMSPHEMMTKRKMRTNIPCVAALQSQATDLSDQEVRDRDALCKRKGKEYWDQRHGVREDKIKVGDEVMMQNVNRGSKWETNYGPEVGEVVEKSGPDTTILFPGKRRLRRHVTMLQKVAPLESETTSGPQEQSIQLDKSLETGLPSTSQEEPPKNLAPDFDKSTSPTTSEAVPNTTISTNQTLTADTYSEFQHRHSLHQHQRSSRSNHNQNRRRPHGREDGYSRAVSEVLSCNKGEEEPGGAERGRRRKKKRKKILERECSISKCKQENRHPLW